MTALPVYTGEELASYPAPELFHLLVRNDDRVPRNLIDECARRGDQMMDVLEPILAKDYYWSEDTTDGEWWLRFHAIMILGRIASARAADLLVAFMRRVDEVQDQELEDWLGGLWPGFFRNKPAAVVEALRELGGDTRVGPYIRSEAVDATVAHAQWTQPHALEPALGWAARIAFDDWEDPLLRSFLGLMLLDFARPEHRRKLEQLADVQQQKIPLFDRKEITQVYFSRGRTPQWEQEGLKDPWGFYEPGAIEARQQQWAQADAELAQDVVESDEPYVREGPKTGRNDPCPCGSGKKFKKCCGG